jgi:hypothetical protein
MFHVEHAFPPKGGLSFRLKAEATWSGQLVLPA